MKKVQTIKNRAMTTLCALAMLAGGGIFAGCSGGSDYVGSSGSSNSGGGTGPSGSYEVLADGTASGRIKTTAPATAGTIVLTKSTSSDIAFDTQVGTYTTLEAALNAAASGTGDFTITLPKGTYEATGLKYKSNNNLTIKGESSTEYGTDVLIVGQGTDMKTESARSLLSFEGSANIVLENITLKNSYGMTEGTAQAETLGVSNNSFKGFLTCYNCSFLSGQDTICTEGKAWFYKCYIEGDVDFLWMESYDGKVALYEECVIRAIGTRTTSAYLTAPRQALTTKVNKGVVLYNSTLQAESGLKNFYLGRNPWAGSTDYYENVAIVGCKLYLADGVTLADDIWKSNANGTSNQQYIGFKTDSYFPKSASGYGAILTSDQIAAEYAGRENILNRVYNISASKFQKDSDSYWDVAKTISDNGLSVTSDSSKSLLSGETEIVTTVYDFANDISTYTDITTSGFANESGKSHVQGTNGSTISFPVTGNCTVTVSGYYKGNGTIKAGSQGEALFDFNNGSTSKTAEKAYIVYGGASTVTISATATTYITKISVEYDDSLTFAPVTGITISAADDATEVASKKTLQFSATLSPDNATNKDIVWSISSGSSVASIDQNGLLTAGSADADTSVTVRATSCDEKAKYGEKTITVKKLEANAFDVNWLDSEAHSAPTALDCTNGNTEIATGATGTVSTLPDGYSWANAKTADKVTAGNGGIYSATSNDYPVPAGYDTFFVDLPFTAVKALNIESISLGGINYGTGNVKSKISYKRASDSDYTTVATDLVTRSITSMLSTECSISVAAGETITIRVAAGAASQVTGGRSPGVPQVTVSGSAQ